MSYILSCGCKSKYSGFPSQWRGEDDYGANAMFYGSLCEHHFYVWNAEPAQYEKEKEQEDE